MIPIRDTAPCYNKPWVTWGLIALCSSIFVVMILIPDQLSTQLINQYGMVPLRYANPQWAIDEGLAFDYYLSMLTNLFLHASWWHLLINMWFLWIFADNIEDRMGRLPFLIFYLLCGILASLLQWYFDPILNIPVVGASGAIAGVLAAYFFLYPLERVILWLPPFFLVPVPAIMFLGIWVIIQLDDATTSMGAGTESVAWWAHLGGFVVGSILYRFFVKPLPPETEKASLSE
jgi:membrane associated rhomboid family serine protease